MIFSSGTLGPGHRTEDVKWLGCLKVGVLQVGCDGRTVVLGVRERKIAVVNMGSGLIGKELKPRGRW